MYFNSSTTHKTEIHSNTIQYLKGGTVIEYKGKFYIRCQDIPHHNYFSDLLMVPATGELINWTKVVDYNDNVRIIHE